MSKATTRLLFLGLGLWLHLCLAPLKLSLPCESPTETSHDSLMYGQASGRAWSSRQGFQARTSQGKGQCTFCKVLKAQGIRWEGYIGAVHLSKHRHRSARRLSPFVSQDARSPHPASHCNTILRSKPQQRTTAERTMPPSSLTWRCDCSGSPEPQSTG